MVAFFIYTYSPILLILLVMSYNVLLIQLHQKAVNHQNRVDEMLFLAYPEPKRCNQIPDQAGVYDRQTQF